MADVNINVFDAVEVSDVGDIRSVHTFIRYSHQNHWLEWWVDGQEIARFKANGDIDLNGTKVPNAF